MLNDPRKRQRLVALFIAGWLLFNEPLLGIFHGSLTGSGLPGVAVWLFAVWALIIIAIGWMSRRGR